ncbi:MAG TPA: YceI family protein [Pseudonocardia sp.]|jgi:polyisoprenoid-binding protein YceI|nr:YceI family protein [Pseudonocardia sp.]
MTASTQALAGTFVADQVHSSFQFTVRHMGVGKFSAKFDDFDVTVVGDEQGVRVEGAVRVDSISIKQPDFRGHVVSGADFFDGSNYPELSFRSTKVALNDDGTAQIDGELTIKGITKPFSATGTYLPVTEDPWGGLRSGVDFEATVDRRDWNFGWQAPLPKGGDALGWQVTLTAHAELVKQA